jgi:hypothetical protein
MMNPGDEPLIEQLRASPRPLPRADLAAQIIRQATAQPQRSGWPQRWQRALSELGYGWQFKLASLALCGVLGVFAGQWQDSPDDSELLLSAQMLDSALYTEEP